MGAAAFLAWLCLMGGCFFILVGAVGILRLPDVYTRMHAAGITDTLGAALVLVGLALQSGLSLVTVKLGMTLVFLLFTSAISTHALGKSALSGGLKPRATREDEV